MDPCGTPALMRLQVKLLVVACQKIIPKPDRNFSCDTSNFKFVYKTCVPDMNKYFADVTEDSSNFFSSVQCLTKCMVQ